MTRITKLAFPFLFILLVSISLSGCDSQAERIWIKAPDWSRAQLIGNTRIGDPVAIAIYAPGQAATFMIEAGDTAPVLRLDALTKGGSFQWTRRYEEFSLSNPAQPELIWDGTSFHMFWRMEESLYHFVVDASGEPISSPAIISGSHVVGSYDVSISPDGHIAAILGGLDEEPGIFGIKDASSPSQFTSLDRFGVNPKIQFDPEGTLHAIWASSASRGSDPNFFYAEYPDGSFSATQSDIIISPIIAGTALTQGPHIGLDADNVYILWSVIYFSGELAGTAETDYVFFPMGKPGSVSRIQNLSVPFEYELDYVESEDDTALAGRRVPLGPGYSGGGLYIIEVNPNPNLNDELVIATNTRQGYLMRKAQHQVNAIFFRNGSIDSYQQLSFTQKYSSQPSVISGPNGYLYFTWLEKGSLPGWAVYFTSSAPEVVQGLESLTQDDWERMSVDTLFGLISGAVLLPFALAWTLPTLLMLVIISRFRGQKETISDISGLITIAASIAILWLMKIAVMPAIREYVPFSAWLPFISEGSAFLSLGIPVLITVISMVVASLLISKDSQNPLFKFMIVYIIVDGILTMAVYGVLIYAAV